MKFWLFLPLHREVMEGRAPVQPSCGLLPGLVFRIVDFLVTLDKVSCLSEALEKFDFVSIPWHNTTDILC